MNCQISDGLEIEANTNTATIEISIGEKTPTDNGDDNTNNTPVENIVENVVDNTPEPVSNIVVSTNTTNNTDKTVTKNKIPDAGIAYGILISVILVATVVVVSYKKYSSMKDIK